MNAEHKAAFEELFDNIYKGDSNAKAISFILLSFLHIWDDIEDGDAIAVETVHGTFLDVLTKLASYPLWDSHMQGTMISVFLRWQAANHIEQEDVVSDNDLAKAWMLRAGCYDLFVMLAYKLHGLAWASQISSFVYSFYGETLEAFIKEVRNA